MATDFTQYVSKFQDETLKAVKQAQDANMAAFEQARELFTEVATLDKMPTFESIPSPTKFVEMSFDYANKMLELRKEYALQVAEFVTETAKSAAKAASKN
ncbi:MAG TPA: hypothetical protein VFA29_06455 [Candidatus Baltobacteraceae bacterium]|nr:hypothetical protein [Candidatus Baltobacteraceae bacterium]